jgi:ankyrin repeat protein
LADNKGQTLLFLAAKNELSKVVKLFPEKDDVDVNLKDKYGRTALGYAM